MGNCSLFLLLCMSWNFFILGTYQLQSSQTQLLLQLRKQLEYPNQLDIWKDHTVDFCYLSSPAQVNITCQDNILSELKITGDKLSRVSNFNGFAIPKQTLSERFSMDSFVTTLARLTSLRVLSLVSVGIWGPLPDKIHRLFSLEMLDLSSNFLFGSVPPKISTMVNLQSLALNGNFFNGTIPDWFDSLSNLTKLSLRENQLKGPFPYSIHRITTLTMLALSGNELSGKVPDLSSLTSLHMLDLSKNKFDSELPNMPKWLLMAFLSNNSFSGTALDKKVVKFGGNCLSNDLRDQHPESYCVVHMKRNGSGGKNVGILIGVIGGIFVVSVFLAFGLLVMCRRYYPRGVSEQHLLHKAAQDNPATGFSSDILTSARFISEAVKLGTQGFPVCRSFSLAELKEATNNFDISTSLGEGSNGKLYKGRLENATQVAIRCMPLSRRYPIRNLKLRLDLLAKLRHPNLVCLLGHCIDDGGRNDSSVNKIFLIYEYVPNGNFRSHLSENSPQKVLKWSERLTVLIGVAKAVHFLHTGIIPGFFNNRLKTNDILLSEHRMAKLSDYGLSLISGEIDKQGENVDGSKSWQMTNLEDDVNSFGFILLESLVGPSVAARRENFLPSEMASFDSQEGRKRIVDPIVLASCSQESLSVVISIMNKCISPDSWSRPSFEDVLWNLQYAGQLQATVDGDQRFDIAPQQ